MAEMVRNPDYLKRHLDVRDRVRNLETGVHPTGSHLNYYDTYGPTDISIRSGSSWQAYTPGASSYIPRWQRRTGLVMLSGAVVMKTSGVPPASDQIATLPAEARPLQDLTIMVSSDMSPYRARIKIQTDGSLFVLGSGLTVDFSVVRLEGAMWAVN